jgi:hypothetical protein
MADIITIPFQGDPAALVERARALAAQNNIQFSGDPNSGNFSGDGVVGTYQIANQVVTITITQRPWYISVLMLQGELQTIFT